MAAALHVHNYRLYFVSQAFANTGGWMARVAIDWLVLELAHDVALVGLAVTLGFLPTILLGPWAGVLSDTRDRRTTLVICMSAAAAINGALATLVLLGQVQVWHVLVAALVGGALTAIDQPSRAAFIAEMVGTDRLGNAIALTAVVWQLSGLVGPAVSGAAIAIAGSGWSIAINSVTTLVSVAAVAGMRGGELIRVASAPRGAGMVTEAVRYISRKQAILVAVTLLGVASVFAMNMPVLLTAAASHTFRSGSTGYGISVAALAAGALVGALLAARRAAVTLRALVIGCVALGLLTIVAGLLPTLPLFLVSVVALGVARLLFTTAAETITQLSTNTAVRGRVMAFFLMVTFGGQAVGGLVIGGATEYWGPAVGFLLSGAPLVVAGVVTALALRQSHR
jgi:MFS family permease